MYFNNEKYNSGGVTIDDIFFKKNDSTVISHSFLFIYSLVEET